VIALGRKSWLFAGADRGGGRAAVMYTLIQTARLNDVDPQAWLADVLARINDPAPAGHAAVFTGWILWQHGYCNCSGATYLIVASRGGSRYWVILFHRCGMADASIYLMASAKARTGKYIAVPLPRLRPRQHPGAKRFSPG